jgi:Asp/Glu/hydantoin racemase
MYRVKPGRSTYGNSIGVIMQHDGLIRLPGDIGNLTTYDYPVTFRVVREVSVPTLMSDEVLNYAEPFIQAACDLEEMGCTAITGGCGFLALLQPLLAEAVSVPVFSSALIQVPLVRAMLRRDQAVGIVTANARNLSEAHFNAVGWSTRDVPVEIVGIDDVPGCEFNRETLRQVEEDPTMLGRLEASMISLVRLLLERRPETGAIVFECTNMPPFAAAVQHTFNLPIFDSVTLANMVHEAVTRRPYTGHL